MKARLSSDERDALADVVPEFDDQCIADDSTECDCSACTGEQLAWEHWQGWHHEDGVPLPEDGCPGCEAEAPTPTRDPDKEE